MQGILLAGELLDAGLGVVGSDLAAYDLAAAAAREQGDAVRVPRQSREKGSGTAIDWRRFSTPRSVRSPVRGGVTTRRTGGLGLGSAEGVESHGDVLPWLCWYSYHAFITDRAGEIMELEADHRRHAEIENAIRDLKYGVGLNHLPSGRFAAFAAWLAVQVIAHNLACWTARLGSWSLRPTIAGTPRSRMRSATSSTESG